MNGDRNFKRSDRAQSHLRLLTQQAALIGSILLICVGLCNPAAFAADHIYTYTVQKQGENELIGLFDKSSKQTIWTRKVVNHYHVGWSRDRKGLCIGVTRTTDSEPSILVWREHTPVQISSYNDDYMLSGIEWSPDNKRVLIRTGFSGASDVDLGSLRCFNLQTHKFSTMNNKSVRKAAWVNSHKAFFWTGTIQDQHVIVSKKPKVWCPS